MELPVAVEPRLLVFHQKRGGFFAGGAVVGCCSRITHTHTHNQEILPLLLFAIYLNFFFVYFLLFAKNL